ncbi:MAG: CRTAC1 family protein [Kiritimatiellaeota bacterium]|nr:CRTAC1 family protein [Kiritimatiellota bacterium]
MNCVGFKTAPGLVFGAFIGFLVCGSGAAAAVPADVPPFPPGGVYVPRFQDVTEACGFPAAPARFINWCDIDNDGRPDLLLDGARLYHNDGPPRYRFTDVSRRAGLEGARPGPALCVDLDNDGWTDIVTASGRLLYNNGDGSFTDHAAAAGFRPNPKTDVIGAGDIDGDGFVDLYLGMGEDWNKGDPTYYSHQLWKSDRGRHFTEIGRRAGIDRKTYARAVLFADVDGDGRQDIFVGNYRLTANVLWHNLGNDRFEDRAKGLGIAGRYDPGRFIDPVVRRRFGPNYGHTIGACWLDYDNDGLLDLVTANLSHKYVGPSKLKDMGYDIRGYICDDSAFYRRTGKRFTDRRAELGVPEMPRGGAGTYRGDELWAGCAPADVNNDGWVDLFVPQIYNLAYAKARLFMNVAGRGFDDAAWVAGLERIDTYAGAWADVDGDGLLDLATAGRAAPNAPVRFRLYRNTGWPGAPLPAWLKVRLRPSPHRRTFIGAVVTVEAGALRQVRLAGAGLSSHGQQNGPTLHFGLGAERGRARVIVRWPDGRVEQTETRTEHLLEILAPDPR